MKSLKQGKKKKGIATILMILLILGVSGYLIGCSNKAKAQEEQTLNISDKTEKKEETNIETEESTSSNLIEITKDETEETKDTTDPDVFPDIPDTIECINAEAKPNKELEKLIIKYFEIPEEYLENTKYYYNFVDLNYDNVDEIFVVVMGPYTSGTGGSTALIIAQIDGKLHVNQDLTIVNTPVIISDVKTNGAHEIIVPISGGGGETGYSVLTYSDGNYTNVPDGKVIKTLEGISGKAIICNDILKDIEEGNILTLSK